MLRPCGYIKNVEIIQRSEEEARALLVAVMVACVAFPVVLFLLGILLEALFPSFSGWLVFPTLALIFGLRFVVFVIAFLKVRERQLTYMGIFNDSRMKPLHS
jgi:uncharacterized RDD family membrane protein YckC